MLLAVLLGADEGNWPTLMVMLLYLGFLAVPAVAPRLFRTLDAVPARDLALVGIRMLTALVVYLMR